MMRRIFVDQEREDLFRKQGYIVQPFLSENEVEDLKNFYYDTLPEKLPNYTHATMLYNDPAYRKKVDLKIKNIAKYKIDDYLKDYCVSFANFIIKEAYNNSNISVHQDWSYMDETEGTSVTAWVPLVDTDESNGCLYIWPGSHVISQNVRYTPYEGVEGEEIVKKNAIPLKLKKGEAAIFHNCIFHFSGNNLSGQSRPAIGMVCIPSEVHPYHFHKTSNNGSMKIEGYQVDTNFYYHYQLNQKPKGYPKIKELEVPPKVNLYQNSVNKTKFSRLVQVLRKSFLWKFVDRTSRLFLQLKKFFL